MNHAPLSNIFFQTATASIKSVQTTDCDTARATATATTLTAPGVKAVQIVVLVQKFKSEVQQSPQIPNQVFYFRMAASILNPSRKKSPESESRQLIYFYCLARLTQVCWNVGEMKNVKRRLLQLKSRTPATRIGERKTADVLCFFALWTRSTWCNFKL